MITKGSKAGYMVLVDTHKMDPFLLLVVTSPDLDVPSHPDEERHWIWKWDLADQLAPGAVAWTGPYDKTTADRFN